ncbi:FmdB family zinc ribbon protein [Pseudofrankia asymbiotica]|uniref:FmdB family transcriptional regulator n=1 Tax=Pseudofrankia asymbiotica TaxID=1834516 RepID=A0A1V2I7B9_9ACTN|nr:zinc ribbon domain-containing protein [Pseudofrankia asymbiotica]ONH26142.1 FmdB family transcriptional regulator [Pseudofrankia asymbiotica]
MPRYDYRCRVCDASFEVRRGIHEDTPASSVSCPAGHSETSRVFSAVAVSRGAAAPLGASVPAGGGGGCCGGGCGCG